MKILTAYETPDHRWRVEVVQRGRDVYYQLVHDGEAVHQKLAIATVQHMLAEAGVDMADLIQANGDADLRHAG